MSSYEYLRVSVQNTDPILPPNEVHCLNTICYKSVDSSLRDSSAMLLPKPYGIKVHDSLQPIFTCNPSTYFNPSSTFNIKTDYIESINVFL